MNNNDVGDALTLSDSFNIQRDPDLGANVTIAKDGGKLVGVILWGPSHLTGMMVNNPSVPNKIISVGFDPDKAYTTQIIVISEDYRGQGVGSRLSLSLRAEAISMGYTSRLDFGYRSESVVGFATANRGSAAIDLDHTDVRGYAVSLFPLV
tara:strand:- start:196 stop:648 length:453 start_codon:yes stop_codon:yes gene_type:complete